MSTETKLQKPDLRDAIACQSKTDADGFIEVYARYLAEAEKVETDKADEKARFDVCYFAAIYAHTELARVQELFGAKHPVYQAPERGSVGASERQSVAASERGASGAGAPNPES